MTGKAGQNEALALALARGECHADAARAAGISVRTVQRRLEDPDFRKRVYTLRSEVTDRTVGLLADASVEAVGTLRKLLSDPSPTIRLGASRAVLEHVTKLRESSELAERLEELEDRLEGESRVRGFGR